MRLDDHVKREEARRQKAAEREEKKLRKAEAREAEELEIENDEPEEYTGAWGCAKMVMGAFVGIATVALFILENYDPATEYAKRWVSDRVDKDEEVQPLPAPQLSPEEQMEYVSTEQAREILSRCSDKDLKESVARLIAESEKEVLDLDVLYQVTKELRVNAERFYKENGEEAWREIAPAMEIILLDMLLALGERTEKGELILREAREVYHLGLPERSSERMTMEQVKEVLENCKYQPLQNSALSLLSELSEEVPDFEQVATLLEAVKTHSQMQRKIDDAEWQTVKLAVESLTFEVIKVSSRYAKADSELLDRESLSRIVDAYEEINELGNEPEKTPAPAMER
ncbi:MAG: hypothetical protein COV36_05865 [Alphaproteobacteria bacterium CG11_big_fil_rev_8_21_14_0_20_44_7]|nr:MAG: hypothetical protein COV36_05865 [Alphaproteobacteria bacterium CG11_big_fil_rev_8_21_14_0_20_44_7]